MPTPTGPGPRRPKLALECLEDRTTPVYLGRTGFTTLAEDDDPLDALVMVNEATFSGCLIEARVVGIFRMKDKGFNDFKVLAVPHKDPLFEHIKKLPDVPAHFVREVEFFFTTYKQLEGVTIEPMGWASTEDGTAEVRSSVDRFRASLGSVHG